MRYAAVVLGTGLAALIAYVIATQPPSVDTQPFIEKSKDYYVRIIRDNYGVPHIYGKTDAEAVYEAAVPSEEGAESLRPSFFEKTLRLVTGRTGHQGILIDGMDDLMVQFGPCCAPVPVSRRSRWTAAVCPHSKNWVMPFPVSSP